MIVIKHFVAHLKIVTRMYEHELHHTIWIECGVSHMQEKKPPRTCVCNQTHVWVNDQKCTYINAHKAHIPQGLHLYIPWITQFKVTNTKKSTYTYLLHHHTDSHFILHKVTHCNGSRIAVTQLCIKWAQGEGWWRTHESKNTCAPKSSKYFPHRINLGSFRNISLFFFYCPSWKTKRTSLQTFLFLIEICTCFVCWVVEVIITYYLKSKQWIKITKTFSKFINVIAYLPRHSIKNSSLWLIWQGKHSSRCGLFISNQRHFHFKLQGSGQSLSQD